VHAGGAERQEGQGRVPAVREGEARRTAGLVNHGRGELNRGRGQRRQGCFRRHGEAQERRQGDDGEQGQGESVLVVRPEAAAVLGPGPPPPVPAGAAAARRVPRLVSPTIKLRYPSSSSTVSN
jgi:hypothetical protein